MNDLRSSSKLKRGRPKNNLNLANKNLISKQKIRINLDSNEECKFDEQKISSVGDKQN